MNKVDLNYNNEEQVTVKTRRGFVRSFDITTEPKQINENSYFASHPRQVTPVRTCGPYFIYLGNFYMINKTKVDKITDELSFLFVI